MKRTIDFEDWWAYRHESPESGVVIGKQEPTRTQNGWSTGRDSFPYLVTQECRALVKRGKKRRVRVTVVIETVDDEELTR